jgi:Predicted nucleoside-diphosphate-sugar epimerases
MSNILLFGATGHAGRAIAHALKQRGHYVAAVVRNEQKARALLSGIDHFVVAEATKADSLRGICSGFEVVVSALGKSVSPNDWSRPTFEEVDYHGNMNILAEAVEADVKQFVYISAFGAETMRHLTYFRVHDDFSNALKASGLSYYIVQPPAIMSSFLDLAAMARKGWLVTIGTGDKRTNPISEQDLANICAGGIGQPSAVVRVGGRHIYDRHQINEVIQNTVAPGKKVRRLPAWVLHSALPFWKVLNRNMYDKLAFFSEIIEHDLTPPPIGETSLEAYFDSQVLDSPDSPRPF